MDRPRASPAALSADDRIEQVLRSLEMRGITIIRDGPDADDHLASIPARAAYLVVDGEPGVLIVGSATTYADAKHEEHHALQHEARTWRSWDSSELPLLEAEAHRLVLARAQEYDLSPEEVRENQRLLEYWEGRIT